MRNCIGRGALKNLLGSRMRQLSEGNCPTSGFLFRQIVTLYGGANILPLYVDEPDQVWGVQGVYRIYSNHDIIHSLKPYGQWRITIRLEMPYRKIPAGDSRDVLTAKLIRFQTDSHGEPNGGPIDLIQKSGSRGIVVDNNPADAAPTWTWDVTQGPFTFEDSIIVPEQSAYCFVGFDVLFTAHDPQPYLSGTTSGIQQPYGAFNFEGVRYIGAGNSDPLGEFNSAHQSYPGPPPASPGDWELPLAPFLTGGAIQFPNDVIPHPEDELDQQYPGWRDNRMVWRATISAQRLSLTALFTWSLSGGLAVAFTNASFAQGVSVTWLWNFGDGTTSGQQNPGHTFPSSGKFRVTLKATDTIGETSTFDQLITIPLKANFTFILIGIGGTGKMNVLFTNTSVGGTTWDWDFGDGSPHSTVKNPNVHLYTPGQSYTVILTVGDGTGVFDSVSKVVST